MGKRGNHSKENKSPARVLLGRSGRSSSALVNDVLRKISSDFNGKSKSPSQIMLRGIALFPGSPPKAVTYPSPHRAARGHGDGQVSAFHAPLGVYFRETAESPWEALPFFCDKPRRRQLPNLRSDASDTSDAGSSLGDSCLQGLTESKRWGGVNTKIISGLITELNPVNILGRNQPAIMGEPASQYVGRLLKQFQSAPETTPLAELIKTCGGPDNFEWLHLIAFRFWGLLAQDKNNLVGGTRDCNAVMLVIESVLAHLVSTKQLAQFHLEVEATLCRDCSDLATQIDYTITSGVPGDGRAIRFVFFPLSIGLLPLEFSRLIDVMIRAFFNLSPPGSTRGDRIKITDFFKPASREAASASDSPPPQPLLEWSGSLPVVVDARFIPWRSSSTPPLFSSPSPGSASDSAGAAGEGMRLDGGMREGESPREAVASQSKRRRLFKSE